MLRLDEQLWVEEHPLRVFGAELGRRMTVAQLADGELWLHSVARLTPELRSELDAIGPVGHVVSPTLFHNRYMEQYREAYPEARLLASPGLPDRREDLSFDGVVGDEVDPAWASDLDQLAFGGTKGFTEIVFYHAATRTLILTDLCFNLTARYPLSTRVLARVLGVYDRLAVSRIVRMATRDRASARASLERILAWDFDRVVIGHGEIVERGGRQAVDRAFQWLRA